MTKTDRFNIALLGNPNSGKSSLFNFMTGLRQDVSNFPGVTVDKKRGSYTLKNGVEAHIIDFPGTYSVYPNSSEEKLVINILADAVNPHQPDLVVYVADITQLERHLLFATQIIDMGYQMVFVLNMTDLVEKEGSSIHLQDLKQYLGVPIICISVRDEKNLEELESAIEVFVKKRYGQSASPLYQLSDIETFVATRVQKHLGIENIYTAKIIAHHYQWLEFLREDQRTYIRDIIARSGFDDLKLQVRETMQRYDSYSEVVKKTVTSSKKTLKSRTDQIDGWITHRFIGPLIFFMVMLFVFQSIYSWATYPMDWIETGFATAGAQINHILPDSWWTDLIVNGLMAGLGGVLVFVPQIAVLFFLLSILEESGYMSRVVFMFDSIMQKFGMNGRSMVSLISSGACAIPAIMSTRTISNPKERLITILVSPLVSCSARLPVYAVLIGFAVPDVKIWGILNMQGLAFMGLYVLGILGALGSSLVFKKILKSDSGSFLMIELPDYKPPIWKNVILSVKEKVIAFIAGAGKIIVFISVILWFLASFGPGDSLLNAEINAKKESELSGLSMEEQNNLTASYKIEASYIGRMGKWIEPAIAPLGFDWKIGIALLTSFAAREVFVGTMATIYSIGNDNDEKTIRQKMAAEVRPGTDIKVYNTATSFSLLVFYVFAMQCMSTLAIVKRETNTWKWPIIQFLFMSAMAYVGALVVYQVLA